MHARLYRQKQEYFPVIGGGEMYAERSTSFLSRSGPALAVIGVHVLLIYGLIVSMGIVEMPKFATPVTAVFIPEQTEVQPEPEIQVKPEFDASMPVDEPLPEVQFEEPIAPPAETPIPASENAIAATAASGAVAQELKTSHRVDPTDPPISRRMSEEGTVRLKVLVDERGRPRDVKVAQTSGFGRLDQAAIEAVRRWRFEAATDGTNPITAWTQVAVTFKLTNANAG
jgi:periplasmic protein TonB